MATYEAAKAQVWANQRPDDVAVGFVDDPVVMRRLREAPAGASRSAPSAPTTTSTPGDERRLVGPAGTIARVSAMRRSLPHDLTNALAASALVLETGLADAAAIAEALASFTGPPHRLEHVGTWNDVAWYNDSKATTPHAAAAAVRSFDRLVLIAGGYDKGVDLAPMAADSAGVEAVIAIGDTADRIAAAFATVAVVEIVADLAEAVDRASQLAQPGATVLLSPGCASFDWYSGFEARGDHFRSLVLDRFASSTTDIEPRGVQMTSTISVGDRRRAALERLHGGAEAPRRQTPTQRASRARGVERRSREPRAELAPEVLGPPPGTFYAIAGVVSVLVMLGLVMVLSASAVTEANLGHSPYRIFAKQAMWAGLGLIALVAMVKISYRRWQRWCCRSPRWPSPRWRRRSRPVSAPASTAPDRGCASGR